MIRSATLPFCKPHCSNSRSARSQQLPSITPADCEPASSAAAGLSILEYQGPGMRFSNRFTVPGPHILNGAEVVGNVDARSLSWLSDYRYVSVRDLASLEKVRVIRPDAVAVPCSAVLLEPPHQDYCRQLPGLKLLDQLHGSEYAVIDFESVSKWKCPMQSVVVNTRGWNVQDTNAEFQHRNPDVLLALLAGARVCVATTLHLSILAMAAGTPFVYDIGMSGTPDKGRLYWTRAGLPDVLYDGNAPIVAAMAASKQMLAARRKERDLATKHFDQIARLLKEPSS